MLEVGSVNGWDDVQKMMLFIYLVFIFYFLNDPEYPSAAQLSDLWPLARGSPGGHLILTRKD